MDPNQIRLQLNQAWQRGSEHAVSSDTFSQMIWQTMLKEPLSFEEMGGEGFGGSAYGDWVKEGFSAAIAAQLARQSPLPFPGTAAVKPESIQS